MIQGIIFDYGGTLDSRGEHWIHVLRRGWQAAGIDFEEARFRQAYVCGERTLARYPLVAASDDFETMLRTKSRIALYAYQIGAEDALSEDQINCALQQAPSSIINQADIIASYCDQSARACIEEAKPILSELAERYPLCLVSNFYGNVAAVLRAYGIRKYFSHIIESAVVGVRKPDPRIFQLGVISLGLKPEEVLVVGDSLKKDILPAESIGCHTAWIKGPGWSDKDDASDHAYITALNQMKI